MNVAAARARVAAWTPERLGAVVAVLVVAATAAAADLAHRSEDVAARSEAFQRLTGGLGAGPALDPSSCAAALDPRIAPSCPDATDPIPGLTAICPWNGRPGTATPPR